MKQLKDIISKRKIKPIIALFLIFGIVLSLIFQIILNIYHRTQPRDFPDSWTAFTQEKYEYSVDYPENWRSVDYPQGSHGDFEVIGNIGEGMRCFGCVRFGDIGPSIYIAYREIDNPTIEQVLIWGEERIEKKAKDNVYQLEDTQITEINGYQAVFQTYQHKDGISRELEPAIDAYILRENSAIIFSLDVEPKDYEEIVPIFESIVKSFHST